MTESKKDTQSCVRHEWELLLHIWDWEWEMAKPIPNFCDWEWEWKIYIPTCGIGNGNENLIPNFGIGNGNDNLIPNIWEWEMASHFPKSWEYRWEF